MQRNPRTALAQAAAPDADRAGRDTPNDLPDWLVRLLVLLLMFARRRMLAACRRSALAWIHERPDLAPGSAPAIAASIRGNFGNAIAWMCLRRGIGPGHCDWPYLARSIVAFGGSLARFRPGQRPCGLQWWENPHAISGMVGDIPATPAADAMASLQSRASLPASHAVDGSPAPVRQTALAAAAPATEPALRRSALARVSTGPPTGPPAALTRLFCCAERTGPDHGQPRRSDSCRAQINLAAPCHDCRLAA